MQNLDAYFKEKGFFDPTLGRAILEAHAENHMVRLRMSERYKHLGILHYRDDVVFGKGHWTEFSKACRGVIVDFQNGKLLAKPFRKFFNVGESHAPSLRDLEKRPGFSVMEKLDGSMGISVYDEVTKEYIVSTKGSIDSEQGIWATPHLPPSVKNVELLRKYTLMWEIISNKYQIVIPYDKKGYEEGLYLIGVRENISEKLFQPDEVTAFAKEYGLRTFKTYSFPSIQSILDNSKDLPFSEEGYVIRFKDEELMVKVKSSEYLRVHRFLSSLSDKNILDVMIAGQEQTIYDNIGMVPEEYREDVETTLAKYKREALEFRDECYKHYAKIMATIPEATQKVENWKRKAFAMEVAKVPDQYKGFLFKMYDNKDPDLVQIYMFFKRNK